MSVPNIEKLFQYLHCVAKSPIKFDGKLASKDYLTSQIIGDQITDIRLNKTFFYTDSCQMCGGCDPSESNVYTESEYSKIQNATYEDFLNSGLDPRYLDKLKAGLVKESYRINEKLISVWVYKQEHNELYLPTREKILTRCTWCFQESEKVFKCRIHPVESITCIMPHLRIFHVRKSNRSSIGLSQFGRNWQLKCPVVLVPPKSENEFYANKENRINKLKQLHQIGLDLNIDTYLPEVIEYIEKIDFSNHDTFLNRNVLVTPIHQRKLF